MKVKRRAGRNAAMLLGMLLAAAGISAGGASATALASGCGSAGAACGSARAGHLSARAEALALLGHRGSQPAVTGTGAAGAPGALAGVPGVVTPGSRSVLFSVYCLSASNCLAVGNFDSTTSGATLNQVLHWNGRKWSKVAVPSPAGTAAMDFSELDAVRCRTASDCWAVGDYSKGQALLSQALHWNGTRWAVVRTPNPGGTRSGDNNQLFDVVCTSARACWAAGQYGNSSGNGLTLNQALHWNGRRWSLVSTPQPAGTGDGAVQGIASVRCSSASNCLAIGTAGNESGTTLLKNEALRWNGKKWSILTIASPGGAANGDFSILSSLACTSATNCWAAGSYGSFSPVRTSLNQIMHWNGRAWSHDTAVANPDGTGQGSVNELNGATCSSASNCWAVGDFGSIQNGVGKILNEALRWNGRKWSVTSPPNPGGTADGRFNILNAVRCTAATNCWAVGRAGTSDRNQALHWHGTRWSAG